MRRVAVGLAAAAALVGALPGGEAKGGHGHGGTGGSRKVKRDPQCEVSLADSQPTCYGIWLIRRILWLSEVLSWPRAFAWAAALMAALLPLEL